MAYVYKEKLTKQLISVGFVDHSNEGIGRFTENYFLLHSICNKFRKHTHKNITLSFIVFLIHFQYTQDCLLSFYVTGKDACGKCNGDNSTCLDCAGVPNGLKKKDLCGACLLPSDPNFNTGCGIQLGKFSPTVGYVGGMDVIIRSSGLENVTSVECTFNE